MTSVSMERSLRPSSGVDDVSNHDSTANYLQDLGDLVRELALRAKQVYDDQRTSPDAQFLLGRLSALHEIVSLMQEQAVAFNLTLEKVSLEGIDPERDLL